MIETAHFKKAEFVCPCGCDRAEMLPELLYALEELRAKLGKPITVTSGFRCPFHNVEVGGARNSQHILGRAADIRVKEMSGVDLYTVAKTVSAFRGFGQGKNYLHVDVRLTRAARWMYNSSGSQIPWNAVA
jgi:uncharacterized protein YcbK (DUF882 family)